AAWRELEAQLPTTAQGFPERRPSLELRHAGTDHAVEVFVGPEAGPDAALAAFADEHRRRFGFDRPGQTVELVNVRLRVRGPAAPLPPVDDDPWGLADAQVAGPRLLATRTTSVWVPPGWTARRHRGLLWLEATSPPAPELPTDRT